VVAEICLIIAVTLATRVPFVLAPSSDRATQLWMTEVFARNRRIAPLRFDDSLRDGVLAYPPLPLFLFAFLPLRLRPAVAIGVSLGADVLHALIVYSTLALASSPTDRLPTVDLPLGLALLFTTLPILHPVNARLAGLGSRTIGPLLFTLYGLCLHAAMATGSILACLGCVVFGVAIILASQFALQVMLGTSVLLSVITWSPWPALVLLAVLCVGVLLPGLNILGQLRAKIGHWRWYATARNLHISVRNSWRELRRLAAGRTLAALPRLLVYIAVSTTFGVVALGVGTLLLAAWALPLPRLGDPPPLAAFSGAVCLAGLILCAATVRGPLAIFGEAERYVEYSASFATLLIGLTAAPSADGASTLMLLVLVNIVLSTGNWTLMLLSRLSDALNERPSPDLQAVVDALDERPGRRVVASPIFLASSLALLCRGGHRFLHVLIVDPDGEYSHWRDDLIGYPHLRGATAHFVQRYGADTMVLRRGERERIRALDPDCDLAGCRILYENAGFEVLDLGDGRR
jgi:hypothetical protein